MSSKPGKIKILFHGEKYHAKVFCEQLENYEKGIFEPKYYEELTPLLNYESFDFFHLISSPIPVIKKLKKYKKPIYFHWIGTDVYRFIKDSAIKRSLKKYLINSANVKNLVVSENLQKELDQFKISSTILPLTKLKFINEIPPFPDKFSVLSYVPEKRWDFYNGDLILKLAERMPETEFHLVAAGKSKSSLPNVFFYDFIDDLIPFYKKCSALIRITVHDGLPKMVLETLSYGRYVLWSESFSNCFKVNNLEECISVLNKLKQTHLPNKEGKNFVEKNFKEENIIDNYFKLCKKFIGINE